MGVDAVPCGLVGYMRALAIRRFGHNKDWDGAAFIGDARPIIPLQYGKRERSAYHNKRNCQHQEFRTTPRPWPEPLA
jgi:hypothetical protein